MKKIALFSRWILQLPHRYFSKVSVFTLIRDCKIDPTVVAQYGCRMYRSNIGKYTYINNNCWIINSNIGCFCSIASNVMIGGGKHPLNFVSTSPIFYTETNVFKKCFNKIEFQEYETTVIGNDVWIGSNAFIKGGVTIGHGAVIGAHAVVTKDIEPYSIVAGNPAKIIRKRFDDVTIDKLLKGKWWDHNDEILKESAILFGDVEKFLNSNTN